MCGEIWGTFAPLQKHLQRSLNTSRPMDSFGDYLQEIGRVPLLTDQKEIYCSRQIQAWLQYVGGPEAAPPQVQRRGKRAKERLMAGNLRLVVSICKKQMGSGLELQDMVQEGSVGLSRAAEKFDATRGYKFSTYAYWWIRQGLNRAISQQARTIRIPSNRRELIAKIKSVRNRLRLELDDQPTLQQIADQLAITVEEVTKTLSDDQRTRCFSLDSALTEGGRSLLDQIASPCDEQEVTDAEEAFQAALSRLNEQDAQIIRMRFLEGRTLAEIGKAMDVSREWVRRLETKALINLRIHLQISLALMSH